MLRPPQAPGGVGAAVIQEQDVEAVGARVGERIDEDLEGIGVQIRELQEEALARGRGHRPIDIKPLEGVRDQAHWLDATGCEPPPAHSQQAKATFVLTEHPDWAGVIGRDALLQPLATRLLDLSQRLRVFLCDWAAPP